MMSWWIFAIFALNVMGGSRSCCHAYIQHAVGSMPIRYANLVWGKQQLKETHPIFNCNGCNPTTRFKRKATFSFHLEVTTQLSPYPNHNDDDDNNDTVITGAMLEQNRVSTKTNLIPSVDGLAEQNSPFQLEATPQFSPTLNTNSNDTVGIGTLLEQNRVFTKNNSIPSVDVLANCAKLSDLVYYLSGNDIISFRWALEQSEFYSPQDLYCETTNTNGTLVAHTFYNSPKTGVQAMIVSNLALETTAVVFRGFDYQLQDFMTGADVCLHDLGMDDEDVPRPKHHTVVSVLGGIKKVILDDHHLMPALMDTIDKVLSIYPHHSLVCTGHSLGGNMATLCGVILSRRRQSNKSISVISFGSSRIGNQGFQRYVNRDNNHHNYWDNLVSESLSAVNETRKKDESELCVWRVVYGQDFFARLPPSVLGYRHVGHLLYLHDDGHGAVAYHKNGFSHYKGDTSSIFAPLPVGLRPTSQRSLVRAGRMHRIEQYVTYLESKARTDPKRFYTDKFELFTEKQHTSDDFI